MIEREAAADWAALVLLVLMVSIRETQLSETRRINANTHCLVTVVQDRDEPSPLSDSVTGFE